MSCDQAQLRLSLHPKLVRLAAPLLSRAQSHFRPPALIRYSCLTRRYLSSRNMVTFIRPSTRDQFTDLKVPKLGSLTEIPAQILFRTVVPTKSWLEQISD